MRMSHVLRVLMADDDSDDRSFVLDALYQAKVQNELDCVEDGEQLLDYLRARGAFFSAPRPDLILLDLNMPRKDGFEALAEIKADPELRAIPVIVFTSSSTPEDVTRAYQLGASGYIRKPMTFEQTVKLFERVSDYWRNIALLPGKPDSSTTPRLTAN